MKSNGTTPKRMDDRAMERYELNLHKAARAMNFDTDEELELWMQKQLVSGNFRKFACAPKTRAEKAQDLAWSAFAEQSESKRISMARRALRLSADCADAYLILAEPHSGYEREIAEDLYRKAVDAGRRSVGDAAIANLEKDFWNDLSTRPYMRAVFELGALLQDYGDEDLAIEQWQDLLRLDPADNQKVRLRLVPTLVAIDRYEEALQLINQNKFRCEAALAYSLAFMLFKQNGNTTESRDALFAASEINGAVIRELLGHTHSLPGHDKVKYLADQEVEAEDYVMHSFVYWEDFEGALDWVVRVVNGTQKIRAQSGSLKKTFPGLKMLNQTFNEGDLIRAFMSQQF